jgi:hypothetical protein
MGFLERISLMHHFFHVVHVTLGVMFGVFTHGASLYLVRFWMVFFGVIFAGFVVTHYIYYIRKNNIFTK